MSSHRISTSSAAQADRTCVSGQSLAQCPAVVGRGGLAWLAIPADPAHGVPQILYEIGGLTGFASALMVAPSLNIAVALLINGPPLGAQQLAGFDILCRLIGGQ